MMNFVSVPTGVGVPERFFVVKNGVKCAVIANNPNLTKVPTFVRTSVGRKDPNRGFVVKFVSRLTGDGVPERFFVVTRGVNDSLGVRFGVTETL